MVEITYQVLLNTLQTFGLLVGIIYYLTIMRNQQKSQQQAVETRQAQMFLQMLNRWRDETAGLEVWPIIHQKISNAEEYLERQENDEDFRRVVSAFIGFYEGLGVFLMDEGKDFLFTHPGNNYPGLNCWPVGWPERGTGAVVMSNSGMIGRINIEIISAINKEYND